jgi:hypothetical protein
LQNFAFVAALNLMLNAPWWLVVSAQYHCLVHNDSPTERAGVIPTQWVMPLAIGLDAILLGGKWNMPPQLHQKCLFSVSHLVIE